ncbi:helix-turn-helix transcriptional regulator [Parachryseolinea silvisoli]|uniref:helix-turn-helix transcriptional regulator n=1 Tax=Parachryseolinea silvisoli TaxID=2873601 RepID=UPI002265B501|nr:helix-turn-helix transcriptional regulator [Parachryseolinea silvisoli]MCD9015153.1 helix-turn-helix transcriptional regulator [Parachryseolinea silvisoli]
MINYRTHKPQGVLAEYVRFFWSLEAQVELMNEPFAHRALPDNCIELIFYCKGSLSISASGGEEGNTFASGVFGQTQKFRQFRTRSNFTLFGVYLYPYIFKALFNLPAHYLCNEKVDSETLWGIEGRTLEEQIISAHTNEQRIQLVSIFLLERVKTIRNQDRAFVRHIKSVVDNNSLFSISSFAHDCNLSRRQFERKFKEFSGFSPKDFFDVIRFKKVLYEIEQRHKSLAQIAIDTGYYDQSHLTNEFKKLSGYTPKELYINYQNEIDTRATVDFKL